MVKEVVIALYDKDISWIDQLNDDVKVIVIPDIESVNYGRGVGYEINEYEPPSDSGAMFISATRIRESIRNGDETWKEMVDSSIHSSIEKFLN